MSVCENCQEKICCDVEGHCKCAPCPEVESLKLQVEALKLLAQRLREAACDYGSCAGGTCRPCKLYHEAMKA